MDEDISPEELADALSDLAPQFAEETLVVKDTELQKIVKGITPNIKGIESTLKEGIAFKASSFAAVFKPLVNILTTPIIDIRKTLSNSISNLTDKITQPFKDVRNFLNKPIFNVKDTFKGVFSDIRTFLNKPIFNVRETFKKAFGGVRKLFGFKTKEEKEEAERKNPARAIIKYMKKRIEPLLKKIAGISLGDDDGGILSMLKNLLGMSGLGGLGSALSTLGTAAAALATAVTSFAVGKAFFDNVVSPMMDRVFQRNIDAMNQAYTNVFTQRTNEKGELVGLDEEGRVTTNPDEMVGKVVDRRSGTSPFPTSLGDVTGARVVKPLAEFAEAEGLGPLFSRYITPINELEGLIYDQALKIAQPGGSTKTSRDALLKLVVDYKDTISKLGKDDVIIKSLGRGGKAKLDAIVKAIKNSPFYKSVTDAQIMETTSSGIGTTGRIAGVQVGKISDVDRRNMGVESAPFVAEVFARREIAQQVENELAYLSGRSGSSVPNSPVIVQSNPTSITNPTENYFTSGLAPELSPMEQMLFRPLPPGFGVLQPQ
jgi:hypothetical protein